MTESFDDISAWKRFCQESSRQDFAALYEQYFPALFNYGYRLFPDRAFVKDGIQQLFVKLWKNRSQLGQPASVRQYLYKALRSTLIDETRRQRRWVDLSQADTVIGDDPQEHALATEQIAQEQQTHLQEALKTLSKRQREAIHLKFYEKLPYEEIAAVMGLSIKTVYNLMALAVEKLRQTTHYVSFSLTLVASLLVA